MNFCPNCGIQLDGNVRFCPNCGAALDSNAQQGYQQVNNPYQQPYQPQEPDVPSTGLKVLCFFIPIAGLILFLINNKEKPVSAKAYGKMALIGWCVSFAVSLVFGIIGGVAGATMGYSYLFASGFLI